MIHGKPSSHLVHVCSEKAQWNDVTWYSEIVLGTYIDVAFSGLLMRAKGQRLMFESHDWNVMKLGPQLVPSIGLIVVCCGNGMEIFSQKSGFVYWRHSRHRSLSQVRRIEPTAGHKQARKQIEVEVSFFFCISALILRPGSAYLFSFRSWPSGWHFFANLDVLTQTRVIWKSSWKCSAECQECPSGQFGMT